LGQYNNGDSSDALVFRIVVAAAVAITSGAIAYHLQHRNEDSTFAVLLTCSGLLYIFLKLTSKDELKPILVAQCLVWGLGVLGCLGAYAFRGWWAAEAWFIEMRRRR